MKRGSQKFITLFFIVLLLMSFVYSQDVAADSQKNFLWKVRAKAGTVYILGSVHYLKKEMYPLNKKIEAAFEKAGFLVVEANVDNNSQIDMQKLMLNAVYQGNETLEQHISKETYELVKAKVEELKLPLEIVSKQKPWFLALSLTSLEMVRLGFNPEYGIDKHFLSKAAEEKKILELESTDFQINLFLGFSDREQEMLLLYTIKDLKIVNQELDRLIHAWTTGNAKEMDSLISRNLTEDKRLYSIYEKLIYQRNKNMVSKIEEFLKTKETYFVVIGAGHLVGDKGIIEILKNKGYSIEQL